MQFIFHSLKEDFILYLFWKHYFLYAFKNKKSWAIILHIQWLFLSTHLEAGGRCRRIQLDVNVIGLHDETQTLEIARLRHLHGGRGHLKHRNGAVDAAGADRRRGWKCFRHSEIGTPVESVPVLVEVSAVAAASASSPA